VVSSRIASRIGASGVIGAVGARAVVDDTSARGHLRRRCRGSGVTVRVHARALLRDRVGRREALELGEVRDQPQDVLERGAEAGIPLLMRWYVVAMPS
jgi:hypothetical protein